MKKMHPILASFIHAAGVASYVCAIALLMTSTRAFAGKAPAVISMAAFLMLFIVSAVVTGLLVMGKPILLYADGAKKQAIAMLLMTVAWLFTITVIALIIVQSVSR